VNKKIVGSKMKPPKLRLIITLGIILLGTAAFIFLNSKKSSPLQNQRGFGQRPGGAENFGGAPSAKPRWTGPIPVAPKDKVTTYKGLWSGPFYPEEYTGIKIDPGKDKALGVNIVMLHPGFEINSKGEVRYPPDFPTYEDVDARIGELATKFYQAKIHVGLGVTLTYKEKFSEGQKGEMWAGEPQPFPREVVEKPGYLDEFNQVVGDMAKIAEKYHVYLFTPAGEIERLWGMNVAPSWIQKIVPIVRKNYSGKLYYKGDLHNGEGDNLNFKGYDILGIVNNPVSSKTSLEETRKIYVSDMERGLAWAKRDGVPEVVISEYGYLGDNKMESAARIGLILEEGNQRLNGVFVSIPEPAIAQSNQREAIVSVIKKWWQ
jgi:hypothetical protein